MSDIPLPNSLAPSKPAAPRKSMRPKGPRTQAKSKSMTGEMMAMLPPEVREALPIIGAVGVIGVALGVIAYASDRGSAQSGEIAEQKTSFAKEARGFVMEHKIGLGTLGTGAILGGFFYEDNRIAGAIGGGLLGLMGYGLYRLTVEEPTPEREAASSEQPEQQQAPQGPVVAKAQFMQWMFANSNAQLRQLDDAVDVVYPDQGLKNAKLTDIQAAQKIATDYGAMLDTIYQQKDGAFRFRFKDPAGMSAEPAVEQRKASVEQRLAGARKGRGRVHLPGVAARAQGLALNRPPTPRPYRTLALAAR